MDLSSPLLPDSATFQSLISSYAKTVKQAPSRFVKQMEEISKFHVHSSSAHPFSL
jgi:hypothetical protein